MTVRPSRRRFLQALSAGGALMASRPALAQTAWSIRGAERGRLRLVFYTDVHTRTEWQTPLALTMAADAINAQKADLVLGGGDLITDGFEATSQQVASRWDAYMAMHDAIQGAHHVAIGNHDLVGVLPEDGSPPAADPRRDFKERFGLSRTYRSFEALGYHFLLLDSVRVSGDKYLYHGWVSFEQREWIREELSRIPAEAPIVVVLHIPLLTAHYGLSRGATFQARPNRVVVNNTEVLALFADRNLVLVLQGHLHVSELLRLRGTTFITGGAVCGKWWRGPYFGTAEGFNAITLGHDRVEREYLGYGWQARRPADQ